MAVVPASQPEFFCVSCEARLAAGAVSRHVCGACGVPQPLRPEEDYFSALGVEPRFKQDPAALEKRFYEISRALHPDRFAALGGQARKISLERMSFLNQAYQTLRNPELLRSHILQREGLTLAEGGEGLPGGRGGSQVPAELAESWFELQDALMEDPANAAGKLREFESGLHALKERGARTLVSLEEASDRSAENSALAERRTHLEKLAREIQAQSYLKSMERDVERLRQRLGS